MGTRLYESAVKVMLLKMNLCVKKKLNFRIEVECASSPFWLFALQGSLYLQS